MKGITWLWEAVDGAKRHNSVLLEPLLKGRVIDPIGDTSQNLCLDAAHVGKEAVVRDNGFEVHIAPEEKRRSSLKEIFPSKQSGGWSNSRIPGLTGFASCSCETRKLTSCISL
jgi:hypothetical protein